MMQIRMDEETSKDLEYLSRILGLDRSKTIRWLIQVMARVFKERTEEVKDDSEKMKKPWEEE